MGTIGGMPRAIGSLPRALALALCAWLMWCVPVGAWAEIKAPDQLIREVASETGALMKAHRPEYEKDRTKLTAMVNERLVPHFDFRSASKLVLARHWRTATDEQRARFQAEFRELLVRVYSSVLLKYNEESIHYLPYKGNPADRTATVRIEFRRGGGQPSIGLQYQMILSDQEWKVYDVMVEGVSIVDSYRTSYATEISKMGLDGLIDSIARKNRDGTPEPAPLVPHS